MDKNIRICIVGGGPAGLSAGMYLEKKGYLPGPDPRPRGVCWLLLRRHCETCGHLREPESRECTGAQREAREPACANPGAGGQRAVRV